jgi:hypothetical protein
VKYPDDFQTESSKLDTELKLLKSGSSSYEIEHLPIMRTLFKKFGNEVQSSQSSLNQGKVLNYQIASSSATNSLKKIINFDDISENCLILDKSGSKSDGSPLVILREECKSR